ncbi:sensor histidine kinase [Parabacteroides sp. ZJ-118]|uniref:tetratricopeptide repeat-containing sensor histidine kinase n=1 Tax=Parabacteroides sp. ZJ-118 TaxID=2709398 RepID=UPI0013EA939E|nr:sensor histidine kinase [Parabacteroides sp. ZJ-118]
MRNIYFVLSVYLMIPLFPLAGNTYTTQQREDSLLSLLESSPTVDEQIELYKSLATMYRQTPKEIVYLNKMAEVASSTSEDHASLYYAWANLSRHYYNIQNRDSLIYWSNKIDSLAADVDEIPDALFDARGFICQMDLWDGNYELAMNGAISLYNYARDTKNEYGLICCNENLGLIYQEIHRDSDAIVAYREGLGLLQKRGDNPKFEMQYMGNLIESYLRTNHFTEAKELLARYDEMIRDRERENKEQGTAFPVDRCRALMYIFYADMYVLKDKPKEALEALSKATPILEAGDDYTKFCYNFVFAKYYYLTGKYEKALNIIDTNKLTEEDIRTTELKVDILEALGRYKEALAFGRKVVEHAQMLHDEAFNRQINQLRTLHDLNNQEMQAYELQLREQQLHAQKLLVIILLVISIVLLVMLYIVHKFYRSARHYQQELMKDKDTLLESERQLRTAKEMAEHANRMKSTFIANISHEIRTPLNAIVGFSELISDESISAGEKREFFSIINNNSYLLLNLINDILDLSRLESGNMKFTIAKCDLSDCCRNALASVEHRVLPGVRLTYTPAEDPLHIQTDSIRLQQLLINLLTNSCKFTKEGEINLSYQTDEDKRYVRISVTDTGCGIPEDKQKVIFERFEKIDEYAQGTGLGLSISQTIIEHLGGSIRLDPAYRHGARFVVLHPYDHPLDNPS